MAAAALRCSDAELRAWNGVLGVGSVRANFQSSRALQRKASSHVAQNIADVSHHSVPSSHPQHATESAVPQLAKNTHEIRERLHSALKRRVGPHTGLRIKVVAQATGLTERTIENAMSGETMPRGDTLMALIDFFDASFANEVFAGTTFMVVKLADQRAATAARMINEGAAMLAELGRGK